eukprot:11828756-Karenia_brevis.AAC.1
MALLEHKTLVVAYEVYAVVERVSSLALNPPKCVFVPTNVKLSLHVKSILRDFLISRINPWKDVAIESKGKYL